MKYFISIAVLLVGYIGLASATQKQSTVCDTDECKSLAQYLLNSIDKSIDPCEDFYNFSCHNFIKNNPLPADELNYGVHELLTDKALELIQVILETPNSSNTKTVQNAQSLYSICLKQEDDIALVKSEIQKQGGWLLGSQKSNTMSLEVLLANIALTGTEAIISSAVEIDLINSSQYIIQVSAADPEVLTSQIGSPTNLKALTNFITASAEALGATNSKTTTNQINDLLKFGSSLNNISPVDGVILNYTQLYKKMTIGELQQLTDPSAKTFEWLTYFNALFNLKLTSSEPVGVWHPEYLVKALQLISSTNKDTVANYIILSFVGEYAMYSGGKLFQQYVSLTEALTGIKQLEPRNTSCADLANDVFGFALAKQYVAEAFPASNIPDVQQIAESMKSAFEVGVSQTPFYDPKTLKTIQAKISAIQMLVGYPAWIKDDQAVETYYSNFPEMNGAHFTNVLKSQTSLVQQNLMLLHKKVDKSIFNLNPSAVDIDYFASTNAITLAAGILQTPYYSQGQLKYLIYGALGSIIGESINLAINNDGSQIDMNGNLDPIWPENVLDAIDNTLQCISNQFTSYCSASKGNGCVNGTADHLDTLFGVLGAYDAYQTWVSKNGPEPQLIGLEEYSPNQLLFMNFAQRYCTATVPANIVAKIGVDEQLENKYSVNGALASLKEFSQAFNCKVGPMNLGSKSCVQI